METVSGELFQISSMELQVFTSLYVKKYAIISKSLQKSTQDS